MQEHVALLRPDAPSPGARHSSSALPLDLLESVRGRVRLLAGLLLFAFGLDLALFAGSRAYVAVTHRTLPPDSFQGGPMQWINLAAVVASGAVWWAARNRRVSAARLHTIGSAYEIAICFACALITFWQYFSTHMMLPNMTWVPAVIILFPLVMPGPPRRMLVTASAAAAMSPLALWLLVIFGKVRIDEVGTYVEVAVAPAISVGFAYLGAKVVYGLGRAVAAARDLGSYRLEEKLGQGGMGEVWLARHRMLARPAAIKLIRPALGADGRAAVSEDALRRFEREAHAIARLRSPHTVELFDFGVADNGSLYYVMELLDRLDADRLVRRFGPLPAERVVFLLRRVCHSLSEADSCGLVHRDIKPANIFLCRYGEDCDFVKVLDFGLVKALGEPADAGIALTQENAVQGTPAFIAPEQALGHANLDGRVDIYSAGCVACWLLTGQPVFTAVTPMALLLHHAHTPATAPSTRSELPIPAALDRLVLACLAKDPAARPQSAKDVARQLAELDLPNAWTEDRARAWWAAHRATDDAPAA
ncbi:MAG: serine/threonine-protein kinase [bacterium]